MGIVYPQFPDILRTVAARYPGVTVREYPGCRRNGRPGGFAQRPYAAADHHTAHAAVSGQGLYSILEYEANKFGTNPDGSLYPGNNVHIWPDGTIWVLACGPTATNGQGTAVALPGGETIPANAANSYTITAEVQNSGTGAPYPQVQVDALFVFNVATLMMIERHPRNVIQHHTIAAYRGKSCMAYASGVQGPWKPRTESNGMTWKLADLRDETERRYHGTTPPPEGDDTDMMSVCSWGPGRLDVFSMGRDFQLKHRAFDGEWHEWENLGGLITAAPAACSWGEGRIDIFARGVDDQLWHLWWDSNHPGGWGPWEPLGGLLKGAPTCTAWAPGRIDVFAEGLDGQMYQIAWEGDHWSPWYAHGQLP
jgi:hypothetical protein